MRESSSIDFFNNLKKKIRIPIILLIREVYEMWEFVLIMVNNCVKILIYLDS